MADQETIDKLKARFEAMSDLTPEQREVLTSAVIIEKFMPIMTTFTSTNVEAIQKVKDLSTEAAREVAKKIIDAPKGLDNLSGVLDDIKQGNFDVGKIKTLIDDVQDHWFFGPIFSIGLGIVYITSIYSAFGGVASEATRQIAAENIQPFLLDLGSLSEEWFRHPQNYAFVQAEMRKMGISDKKIEIYLANQKNIMPLGMASKLWHREMITESDIDEILLKLRFEPDDLSNIKETLYDYPGVGDIITFAVREVFSPDQAQQLGLYEDMPDEYVEQAKKAGLPEEFIPMYWASHWTLPSTNQGMEMFQRGVISLDELNGLLKAQDVIPNYRQNLIDIAYNPITRVDIRRLYRDGVIDFDEMVIRYKDTGYSPDDADLLAEWTDREYGEEKKDRTKADILKLYKLGDYNKSTAIERLQGIGYNAEIAGELVSRVDMEKEEKSKATKLRLWKKGYVNDYYEKDAVTAKMVNLGISSTEVNTIMEEWQIEKATKARLLSPQQLEKAYKKDLIDTETATKKLSTAGYTPDDAALLIATWSEKDE